MVEQLNHAGTTTFALTWMIPVFLWTGDLTTAESLIERLLTLTAEFPVVSYNEIGTCLKGEYLMKRGRAEEGLALVEAALDRLSGDRTQATGQICALAEGLRLTGQLARARSVIDEAIAEIEGNGHLVFLSEMLRIKGDIHACDPAAPAKLAEDAYLKAIQVAHRQEAISLELRAALGLGQLLSALGRDGEARERLRALYDGFDEGFGTLDLKAARAFLEPRPSQAWAGG